MNRQNLIVVAASLAINAAALSVIASGIEESSLPRGQVVVTELGGDASPTVASLSDATAAIDAG